MVLSCLLAAGARTPLPAMADEASGPGRCEVSAIAADEPAPELLALADWPLDTPASACGAQTTMVQAETEAAPSLPVIEIQALPAVVQVTAWEGEAPPLSKLPPAALAPEVAQVATESLGEMRKVLKAPEIRLKSSADLASGEIAETPASAAESIARSEQAEPAPFLAESPDLQLAAIDADSLDEIRGGFEVGDLNLKLSFGIERAVYVNGELVSSTVLTIKDLQAATGGSGGTLSLPAGAANALTIIQNGLGNNVPIQVGSNQVGTVIQNSLDNQKIVNITTINAVVNSAEIVRSMNLQSAIQQGVVDSLRR